MEKEERPKHLHKVEKITGMGPAFMLVSEYSIVGSDILSSNEESREDAEEKRKEIGRKGVRKIVELWELSESAGRVLLKKWVEIKPMALTEQEYWELLSEMDAAPLGRFGGDRKDNSENEENSSVQIMLAEEESNIKVLKKLGEELVQKGGELLALDMAKKGHIYLDVTEIDYKGFCKAYRAIKLCRSELGMTTRDMRRGAPESIDETRALLAAEAERSGLRRKEIAKRLDFKVYTGDNPSGSFPLLHKYIKVGRKIADKLDKLEAYLQEITGIKC